MTYKFVGFKINLQKSIVFYTSNFGDIVGFVPDHFNKVSIIIKWVIWIFGFLSAYESCCCSVAQSCPALCAPWTAAHQAALSSLYPWVCSKVTFIIYCSLVSMRYHYV